MKKETGHTINQLMNLTMLSCEDATCLISKEIHEKLTGKERIRLTLHLWSCKFCSRFKRQINYLHRVVRQLKSDADSGIIHFTMTREIRSQVDQKLREEISKNEK
jgi:thioredoxin-related protein